MSQSVLDHYGEERPVNGLFSKDALYSLDTDAAREARQAFTVIDTAGIEDGLEALKNVKNVGAFALKDISRFLDAISNSSKDKETNKNLPVPLRCSAFFRQSQGAALKNTSIYTISPRPVSRNRNDISTLLRAFPPAAFFPPAGARARWRKKAPRT